MTDLSDDGPISRRRRRTERQWPRWLLVIPAGLFLLGIGFSAGRATHPATPKTAYQRFMDEYNRMTDTEKGHARDAWMRDVNAGLDKQVRDIDQRDPRPDPLPQGSVR